MDNFDENNNPLTGDNTSENRLETYPENTADAPKQEQDVPQQEARNVPPQQDMQNAAPQQEQSVRPNMQDGGVNPGMPNGMPQQPYAPYPNGGAVPPQWEQPKKKRFSGGCLWAFIIAVILMFMVIVLAAAAIALRDGKKGGSGDKAEDRGRENSVSDNAERVVVNIPTAEKPVLEEEFYQNKETGLLTPVGVAKTILPSQVKINIFGDMPYTPVSSGSGFIIAEDGYIVTNAHVVDGSKQIAVKLYDGTEEKAKLMGLDKKSDLAVIKINRTELTPAEIGRSSSLVIGEEVALAGAGGGFENTVTYGHVTGLDRSIDTDYISSTEIHCIQSDAALNPGNSGGALVNMYGQVVGVAVALMNHEKYENIGFSIAIDDALPIAEELISKGYVSTRTRIGVTFVSVGDDFAKGYKVTAGLCVMSVDPSSGAIYAGLEPYDIITHINGVRVYGKEEIFEALAGKVPGDAVPLTVFRKEITGEAFVFETMVELAPDTSSMSGYSVENNDEDYFSRDIIK